VEVRPIRPEEWQELRATRLEALAESPAAFWSSSEQEAALGEDEWRRRAAAGGTFMARDGDGAPIGIATGYAPPNAPAGRRHLVGMWVAPRARGRGVAGALIAQVAAWARDDGADELSLWVVDGNDAARRAYERVGFVDTGESQRFPGDDPRTESRMALRLDE
jgi:RimJ/RimL family protein N-acetyltransferase